MCTVVVEVPAAPSGTVRLLAIRDEEPSRAWDPPGTWWPDTHPGVVGVRDRRANGAWLAAAPAQRRLAVILNRASADGSGKPQGPNTLASRGGIVLDAVEGHEPHDPPLTASFNLVSVVPGEVLVTSWDGEALRRERLSPGVHMLAHHEVDDTERTPRIAAWLPRFRELAGLGDDWRERWIALLEHSTELSAFDDRAIIRDNTPHGYPTMSLLACIAEIGGAAAASGSGAGTGTHTAGLRLDTAVFAHPAAWRGEAFTRSV